MLIARNRSDTNLLINKADSKAKLDSSVLSHSSVYINEIMDSDSKKLTQLSNATSMPVLLIPALTSVNNYKKKPNQISNSMSIPNIMRKFPLLAPRFSKYLASKTSKDNIGSNNKSEKSSNLSNHMNKVSPSAQICESLFYLFL